MRAQRARRLRKYQNPRQKGWDPYDNSHPLLSWYFYRRLDVALSLANISPHHTVVDLGSWMGHLEVTIASLAREVIAVDRADEVCREPFFESRVAGWNCLQIAREMLSAELETPATNCIFVRGDMTALPLPSQVADVVFCLDTLEHISDIDMDAALNEINRIMVRGAILIISFPVEFGPALIVRQIASMITDFRRESYGIVHLAKSLLTNRVPYQNERGGFGHAGYDWRSDMLRIARGFNVEAMRFVPIEQLRTINPTLVARARKPG